MARQIAVTHLPMRVPKLVTLPSATTLPGRARETKFFCASALRGCNLIALSALNPPWRDGSP
jgi:hypothetical protein